MKILQKKATPEHDFGSRLQVVRRTEENRIFRSSTRYLVRWAGANGTIREPREKKRKASSGSFTAAGKQYSSWKQLCQTPTETIGISKDIYGRKVFYIMERFPCFDSYDYLHENRYYRWFYLAEGGVLTQVYLEDGRATAEITDDVACITEKHWQEMLQQNWPAGCAQTEEYLDEAQVLTRRLRERGCQDPRTGMPLLYRLLCCSDTREPAYEPVKDLSGGEFRERLFYLWGDLQKRYRIPAAEAVSGDPFSGMEPGSTTGQLPRNADCFFYFRPYARHGAGTPEWAICARVGENGFHIYRTRFYYNVRGTRFSETQRFTLSMGTPEQPGILVTREDVPDWSLEIPDSMA